ncbi:MAG: hypothetical protein AB1716_23000, partial [Planctomycetota bacterium]
AAMDEMSGGASAAMLQGMLMGVASTGRAEAELKNAAQVIATASTTPEGVRVTLVQLKPEKESGAAGSGSAAKPVE